VRFQVSNAASMKMTLYWDAAPCSVVETGRIVRGIHFSILKMTEAVSTSVSSIPFSLV
jgi:hypothetical protein